MSALTVVLNAYGDLQTTRPHEFSSDAGTFDAQLAAVLARPDATRGIWLRLPWSLAPLIPVAAARGFVPHHYAREGSSLILQKWVPQTENPTPLFAHVDHGCGALVVNVRGELLIVRERYASGWGVPGGHLDVGEDLLTGAAREAFEETGVHAVPLGIVGLHERTYDAPPATIDDDAGIAAAEQARRWGAVHHGHYVLLFAADDATKIDPQEVTEARWVSRAEWERVLPPFVAALATVAAETGQLDAARARAVAAARSGRADANIAPRIQAPIPFLETMQSAMFINKRGVAQQHAFYSSAPPSVLQRALAAAASRASSGDSRQVSAAFLGGGLTTTVVLDAFRSTLRAHGAVLGAIAAAAALGFAGGRLYTK